MADTPPDLYQQHRPVFGKPILKTLPTPNLDDRIFVVRKDIRAAGFKLPAKGDAYDGPEAQKYEGFVFSTAQPSDQTPGAVDLFYLNVRLNQDSYNAQIDYPYADVNYPRVTRTYVLLRTDVQEPTADDVDPVFNGDESDTDILNSNYVLVLIDHKQTRLQDPILDALFVTVDRVYERLPSPVITTYDQNDYKQIVTVDTQEVETDSLPVSSATTEVIKVERTTTAKAKVTTGTIPEVADHDSCQLPREDLTPPEFKALIPTEEDSYIEAGQASLPTLLPGDLMQREENVTKFTRKITFQRHSLVALPHSFFNKDMGGLSQGRFGEGFTGVLTITETLDAGMQTITPDINTIDAEVKNLGDGRSLKKVTTVDGGWPILYEREIDPETGIAVNITKKVIPILNAAFGPIVAGYVDVKPYDKWRSIQITSKVDLHTLPIPIEFGGLQNYSFPDELISVRAEWEPGTTSEVRQENGNDPNLSANNLSTVLVSATVRGAVVPRFKSGYRGPIVTRTVRSYLSNAPSVGQIPSPTIIRPVSGVAYLSMGSATQGYILGIRDAGTTYKSERIFLLHDIGPCLVGQVAVSNAFGSAISNFADTTSIDYNDNEAYFVAAQALATGTLVLDIPQSDPPYLTPGQEILIASNLTRWRFGVYVQELIYARVIAGI